MSSTPAQFASLRRLPDRFEVTREDWIPLFVAWIAGLILYSSIWTQFVFNDHTLPNIGLYGYPSFKTYSEGRWFADIIIQSTGGAGTQSFQAIVAMFIQAMSGVIFGNLIGARGWLNRTIIALIVALHPAALDYYAFSIDDITFTIGDALIMVAVLALDRRGDRWITWVLASVCFMLALAAYPPKIAVAAIVLISWLASRAVSLETDRTHRLRMVISAIVTLSAGVALYLISLKVTTEPGAVGAGPNSHMNSLPEMLEQFRASYAYVAENAHRQWLALPAGLGLAPFLLTSLGAVILFVRGLRRGAFAALIVILALALMIPATNLAAIANSASWQDTGRLSLGYTYGLAFFVGTFFFGFWPQIVGRILAFITLYAYTIIGLQENQFIATKNVFETSLMTRIAGRIEQILPDRAVRPLVVIGDTEFAYGKQLLLYPTRPLRPQFQYPAYASYRRPELTNFFLGRELMRFPTDAEVAAATANAKGKPAWPAPGSVYLDGEAVVVILDWPLPNP